MISARCRYCGVNYEFTDFYDDPNSCGRKPCVKAFKNDSFATQVTEAGDSAIQPVEFRGGRSQKVVRKEPVKVEPRVVVKVVKKTSKKKSKKKSTKRLGAPELNAFPLSGTEIVSVKINATEQSKEQKG